MKGDTDTARDLLDGYEIVRKLEESARKLEKAAKLLEKAAKLHAAGLTAHDADFKRIWHDKAMKLKQEYGGYKSPQDLS